MRIGFYSPLPPERSGIADYSFELLEELRNHIDVVAVVGDRVRDLVSAPEGVEIVSVSEAHELIVDCNVYQMGNNPKFHRFMYGRAFEQPGLLVLHDPSLADFTAEMCGGAESSIFREEVTYDCPDISSTHDLPLVDVGDGRRDLDRLRVLLARRIVESNIRTLVHSSAMEHEMRRRYAGVDVATIQLPARLLPEDDPPQHRADGAITFGVFGGINYYKRVRPLVDAFIEVHRSFPLARMVVAGRADEHLLERELRQIARRPDLGGALDIRTDLSLRDLERAMLDCDVGISLRWPTAGEMSATLMRTFGAGRPAIVSDVLQFREIDDRFCWRVTTDFDEEHAALVALMTRLSHDRQLCVKGGQLARNFVATEGTYETVARHYVDHLEHCVAKLRPGRASTSRSVDAEVPIAPHGLERQGPIGVNVIHLAGSAEPAEAARRTIAALRQSGLDVVELVLQPHAEVPRPGSGDLGPDDDVVLASRAETSIYESRVGEPNGTPERNPSLHVESSTSRPKSDIRRSLARAQRAVLSTAEEDRPVVGMGPYPLDVYFVEDQDAKRLGRLARARSTRGRRSVAVIGTGAVPISADHGNVLLYSEMVIVPSPHGAEVARMATHLPVEIVPWPVEPTTSLHSLDSSPRSISSGCTFITVVPDRTPVAEANPMAAIEAFRRAFPARRRGGDVRLIVVLEHADSRPEARDLLESEMASARYELVLDPSPAGLRALLCDADVVVSLHRASGYSLVGADAMALGKPVIATGYGGNLAYMDDASSCLVGYEVSLLESGDYFADLGVHEVEVRGNFWVEPDVVGASRWMQRLATDPALRLRIGSAARIRVTDRLAPAVVGDLLHDLLARLATTRRVADRRLANRSQHKQSARNSIH